jgi:hypothetical protein
MPFDNRPLDSIPAGHPAIHTRGHTTPEGVLHLSIPVGYSDAEVSVILQVKPVPPATEVDENGWPLGFFDEIAGSMPDLVRPPQGEFENRLPFE